TGRNWYSAPMMDVVIQPSVNRCVMAVTRGDRYAPLASSGAATTMPAVPSARKQSAAAKCSPGSLKGGALPAARPAPAGIAIGAPAGGFPPAGGATAGGLGTDLATPGITAPPRGSCTPRLPPGCSFAGSDWYPGVRRQTPFPP